MNLYNKIFSCNDKSESNAKTMHNPDKNTDFHILPNSISHTSLCMHCCSLHEVDYSDSHRISSDNKCFGVVITLHTMGLTRLSAQLPHNGRSMLIFHEFYPLRTQFGSVILLPGTYPTQRLSRVYDINEDLRLLWYQMSQSKPFVRHNTSITTHNLCVNLHKRTFP